MLYSWREEIIMFSYNYEDYKNYGKVIKLTDGNLVAMVTVDVGPRIIYFGNENVNFMWNDLDRVVDKGGEYFDTNFKKGEKWNIYGGHRLWKSPEDLASYVPENYPVDVEILENGARFTTPNQKMTGLKATIEVRFEGGEFVVKHTFKNVTETDLEYSLWALSVLKQGGTELIYLNNDETGLLPNKNFVFWPYADLKDARLDITNDFVTLKQDNTNTNAFKLGMYSKKGISTYLVDGDMFIKRFERLDGKFADYECNFETYTSENFMEMETLSPLYVIKPNEEKSHTEKWSACFGIGKDKNLDEIKEYIKSIVD